MRTLIALMLLSLSLPALSGTVYKWKDARGVVHYSDSRPPSGIKYDTQDFASSTATPSEASASAETPAPSSENARCEKSRQSVAALSQTGVPVMMDLDGDGRLSLAARADYAEAAAAVIASDEPQAGKIHELAGDDAITLADFAAELARQTGKPLIYQDLPQQDYRDALLAAGLPAGFAELLSDSDAGAAKDGLFDDSGTLGRLIGRATTPIADVIGKALAN